MHFPSQIMLSTHSTNKNPKYFKKPEKFHPSHFEGSRLGSVHIPLVRWVTEDLFGQRVRTHGDSCARPSFGHPVIVDPRGSQWTHINQPPGLPCEGSSYLIETMYSFIWFGTTQLFENCMLCMRMRLILLLPCIWYAIWVVYVRGQYLNFHLFDMWFVS